MVGARILPKAVQFFMKGYNNTYKSSFGTLKTLRTSLHGSQRQSILFILYSNVLLFNIQYRFFFFIKNNPLRTLQLRCCLLVESFAYLLDSSLFWLTLQPTIFQIRLGQHNFTNCSSYSSCLFPHL